jgi:hypothetical protein
VEGSCQIRASGEARLIPRAKRVGLMFVRLDNGAVRLLCCTSMDRARRQPFQRGDVSPRGRAPEGLGNGLCEENDDPSCGKCNLTTWPQCPPPPPPPPRPNHPLSVTTSDSFLYSRLPLIIHYRSLQGEKRTLWISNMGNYRVGYPETAPL